jgi:hypothetical protein
MSNQVSNLDTDRASLGLSVLTAPLPNADAVAQEFIEHALGYCCDRMQWGDGGISADRVRTDPSALSFFRYGLAEQISRYVGSMDETVKAVFYYDEDTTTDGDLSDLCSSAACQVHLIAWVSRKTDALQALAAALNRALAATCASAFDAFPSQHLLDLQLADDNDIQRRVGYGAVVTSLHRGALKMWQR